MSKLQNVEKIDTQEKHQKTWFQRFRTPMGVTGLTVLAMSNANAATMPNIDVADIITYIGLLVAAVATVGSAFLMVYLAAKGIKAIRAAF